MRAEAGSGSLRARLREQLRRARASGGLEPVRSECVEIVDRGVRFVVYEIVGRDRKWDVTRDQADRGHDPFLPPYQHDLFVAELSETHVALLNRFPVLDEHLLVVTRVDEPQQSWLTLADFEALARCRDEIEGVAFYNAGQLAGASQPHKHLQLVPMPFTTGALFDASDRGFACAQAQVARRATGGALHLRYRELMEALDLDAERDPYNLLIAADRMVIVPRSRHSFEGIGLNALGYAGSILVRGATQLERLREIGPARVLREVGRP